MSVRQAHGRSAWLTGRCRCEVCRRELLEYSRIRRATGAVVAGREPSARVPASHCRRRVTELRAAGRTVQQIADCAGVSFATIDRIANGRLRNVALSTHRRLMAVWP